MTSRIHRVFSMGAGRLSRLRSTWMSSSSASTAVETPGPIVLPLMNLQVVDPTGARGIRFFSYIQLLVDILLIIL